MCLNGQSGVGGMLSARYGDANSLFVLQQRSASQYNPYAEQQSAFINSVFSDRMAVTAEMMQNTPPSKLQRARTIAAEVRARRPEMQVKKLP